MAELRFNPPEWLIQEYMRRKQPAEIANEGIQQGLQTYATMNQQQNTQRNAASKNLIDLIAQDPELLKTPWGQKIAQQSGANLSGYQPPSISSGTAPSPQVVAPEIAPQTAGTTPISGGSPIIDHWNQSSEQPMSQNPQNPPLPRTLSESDIMGLMGRGKLGKAAVADYATGLGTIKTLEGMGNKRIPFEDVTTTFQAANENPIGEKLISDAKKSGLSYVPEEKMNLALRGLGVKNAGMRGGALDSMAQTRELSLRDSLNKEARTVLNPLFQTGEGRNQMTILNRIGRAEPLIDQMLSQKNAGDKRQMRELAASLDRIIRGGGQSAQSQIDDLMPDTARGKFAHWQEWFTNDPTGTDQKAFVNRYAETLARERTAVQGQVKSMAEKNAPTLRVLKQHYPQDYQAHVSSVMDNPQLVGEAISGNLTPAEQEELAILEKRFGGRP